MTIQRHVTIVQRFEPSRNRTGRSELPVTQSPRLSATVPDRFRMERKHRAGGVPRGVYKARKNWLIVVSGIASNPSANSLFLPEKRISTMNNLIFHSFAFTFLLSSTSAWPFRRRDVLDNSVDSPDGVIAHLQHFGPMLYRFPDNETGAIVAGWHEGWDRNPEELGNYAEGDILFPPQLEKNGLKAESARWPGGVVPYMISPYFNTQQRNLIFDAMNDYHKYTCIKFKPYTGEENDYIRITAGNSGCWSSVGRIGGRQDVNLQVPGCLVKKGTVIHELMHAVGFLHEQSRFERDEYVTIQWQNILNGHTGNFAKASKQTTDAFGVGYDYGSVMHYSANAFSKNGQPTIVTKGGGKGQLGQREGFSKRDIQKIRKMYKCGKRRRNIY